MRNYSSRNRTNYKPIVFVLLLTIGVLWIISRTLFFPPAEKTVTIANKNLLAVPWPSEIDFAGERVPLEDFYIEELWEKNFLVILSQDYQNILYLKRSQKYFPYIEKQLEERGMPEDLKYIAVAESAFLETSTSHAGAAGIWQFIPGTARDHDLIVNDSVDERRHYEKATNAALDYLEFLYNKFDNWTLAAAAYNAGQGGIASVLGNQGVDNYYDLYLNSETANYLFRIIAIKQIMEKPEAYGYRLQKDDYFYWPSFDYITTDKIADIATWARENNTTLRAIKELNPWIISNSLPTGTWRLKIYKN